ncbi:2-amino-4-hydroxy-6-hydroxymethyldihydropteridine diphosphokinase [Luteibacter jiangsuensis]|uniref:2-amino-4-hydroxy-6-hydroxymethyldihydropteridine pyrophosphokinase n=1 Tax=Luteibacter jiangsuensis TaxID=637577 RepID=A0ABT9SZ24_9GAMM|nr:2-amino-4-hydroxy-6-hydroxymethyldihydropteridine diphosphokinase [Luteibacter jiangsuensis]MDQ0009636.1 2-amino-4-hydroxy-6-hydroxymethyldihydropteridine diphosphokinase [Luteibacter jiangsuensis]
MGRAYLSLGSNIDAERWLGLAVAELRNRFGTLEVSPVYRSAAVGFDGPDFLNLAVALDSDLGPDDLNDWLHALEDRHGRVRGGGRYASRTLDVDIVLYDDLVLSGEGHLEIPRGELRHAFVLKPMADIAPTLRHPVSGRTMADLWAAFPQESEPLVVDETCTRAVAGLN